MWNESILKHIHFEQTPTGDCFWMVRAVVKCFNTFTKSHNEFRSKPNCYNEIIIRVNAFENRMERRQFQFNSFNYKTKLIFIHRTFDVGMDGPREVNQLWPPAYRIVQFWVHLKLLKGCSGEKWWCVRVCQVQKATTNTPELIGVYGYRCKTYVKRPLTMQPTTQKQQRWRRLQ